MSSSQVRLCAQREQSFWMNLTSVLQADKQQRAGSTALGSWLMSHTYPVPPSGPQQVLLVGKSHPPLRTQIKASAPRPFLLSLNSCCSYFDLTSLPVCSASSSLPCLLNQTVGPQRTGLCLSYLLCLLLTPGPSAQRTHKMSSQEKGGCFDESDVPGVYGV